MRRAPIPGEMTLQQIIDEYILIGEKQYDAALHDRLAQHKRLYDRKVALEGFLRRRGGDSRGVLRTLYVHPNMQVRFNAGVATLAVYPEEARAVLEGIYRSGWQPQALDAGMILWSIDRGDWMPE